MANLIITVIAIALVAIATLMGAYYGGSAFLNNQQAASASTFLNQGQQAAGAWQAFNAANNVSPSAGIGAGTFFTALQAANYLTAFPSLNVGGTATVYSVDLVNGNYYLIANLGGTATIGKLVYQ